MESAKAILLLYKDTFIAIAKDRQQAYLRIAVQAACLSVHIKITDFICRYRNTMQGFKYERSSKWTSAHPRHYMRSLHDPTVQFKVKSHV